MMSYTNEPDDRRDFQQDMQQEGTSTAAWAAIACVLLLFAGVMAYAFIGDRSDAVSTNPPAIERTTPPVTTGQGDTQSKLPAARKKAD